MNELTGYFLLELFSKLSYKEQKQIISLIISILSMR